MPNRSLASFTLVLVLAAISLSLTLIALAASEIEPNNDQAHATLVSSYFAMTGAISPTGDIDWFALHGVNTTWGYIALLDTISSTGHITADLIALRNNGTTVLQADTASWERGSGIALQAYADDYLTHYLTISAAVGSAVIDKYTLNVYNTIIATQPEVEPNNTRSNGTPSSFTMAGVISPTADVDCFQFQGRANDAIIIALDGDPEKDGSPIDPQLQLISPSNAVLKTANVSGLGGKEFIRYDNLPGNGVYAYCVSAAAGVGGPTATYHVGLVRAYNLYMPDYDFAQVWLNPRGPAPHAVVGDLLTFRLVATNTSPLKIPGNIRQTAGYSSTCLKYVSAVPTPVYTTTSQVSWDGLKPNGLTAGEAYAVTVTFRSVAPCADYINHGLGLLYYFTGAGNNVNYQIWRNVYLPSVRRSS